MTNKVCPLWIIKEKQQHLCNATLMTTFFLIKNLNFPIIKNLDKEKFFSKENIFFIKKINLNKNIKK